jgi:hypothetical protein
MMSGTVKRRCTGRCNVLPGAFAPSSLVEDILVCRFCGEARREPAQPVAAPKSEAPATKPTLYTVGYGGLSLETFLPRLVAQRIQVLLDVRQRAWSANPGFVQETLRRAVEGRGITYRHRPELGGAPELRAQLKATGDWQAFRAAYETVLVAQEALEQQIAAYARTHRVCLLCGERDPARCHRSLLAERLADLAGLTIEHLTA